jgi:hypothetical protein
MELPFWLRIASVGRQIYKVAQLLPHLDPSLACEPEVGFEEVCC